MTMVLTGMLHRLFESSKHTLTILDARGVILEANPRWRDILGIPVALMKGRHLREFAPPGVDANLYAYRRALSHEAAQFELCPILRPDGQTLYMEFSNSPFELEGQELVVAAGHDVTERVRAIAALGETKEKYSDLLERIPEVIWTCTAHGTINFITPNVHHLLGISPAELIGQRLADRVEGMHPADQARVREALDALLESGKPLDLEYRRKGPDGRWIWLRNRSFASYQREGTAVIEGMLSDVTEKRQLEEAFRQAQKMEAIGQFTGAIAHDFNNILAAILANALFLIEDLAPTDPRRADAIEIEIAAQRAAALTRQLLAFSRHQVLDPEVLDLNATLAGLEKMLGRLIGEDIELSVAPAADLGAVRADTGQIEQVIMNLAVNARDAMPKGGRLSIATANVDLDDARAAGLISAAPGRYVMTSVTDNGTGIDEQTLRRLFEPFFTTKEQGKGTGLGLSTCYGIVKQSGGFITVDSEVGQGTVFKIYLPRLTDALAEGTRSDGGLAHENLDGTETVLLIEDDERVRTVVSRMLTARGYQLLSACCAEEAFALVEGHTGRIDLVLSDVIIPGVSGPEIVTRLQQQSAHTKAVFMSGYTDHAILREGALQTGVNFIQKPFAADALARKLRQVLDA